MARLLRSSVASASRWRQLLAQSPAATLPPQTERRSHTAAAAASVASVDGMPDASRPATPMREPQAPRPSSEPGRATRRSALQEARPLSDFLTDTFARQHDYLRISLTERCNLRCLYCMPEEGVPLSPARELLTTPEIVALSTLFVREGVTKIRLTGGEPTVRPDIVPLMRRLGTLPGLRELCLTTNGVALHRKLDAMVDAGLTGINLSLDTLDPLQFQLMTRRPAFDAVMRSAERVWAINRAAGARKIRLKINCVVMRGLNDAQILPFVELTRDRDVEVRFIEYMPFDGNRWSRAKMLPYAEMLDRIRAAHPGLERAAAADAPNDTSKGWRVPGFAGKIGFITSMTHNFCGTCNRLRITSDGNLKVCLFGNAEVSLRDVLRGANGGEPIDERAWEALQQVESDRRRGVVAPGEPLGLAATEAELLEVIGAAVKRKKAKHAGMGELEHMKNRPMILIGG